VLRTRGQRYTRSFGSGVRRRGLSFRFSDGVAKREGDHQVTVRKARPLVTGVLGLAVLAATLLAGCRGVDARAMDVHLDKMAQAIDNSDRFVAQAHSKSQSTSADAAVAKGLIDQATSQAASARSELNAAQAVLAQAPQDDAADWAPAVEEARRAVALEEQAASVSTTYVAQAAVADAASAKMDSIGKALEPVAAYWDTSPDRTIRDAKAAQRAYSDLVPGLLGANKLQPAAHLERIADCAALEASSAALLGEASQALKDGNVGMANELIAKSNDLARQAAAMPDPALYDADYLNRLDEVGKAAIDHLNKMQDLRDKL
jgi:hypothetical protein